MSDHFELHLAACSLDNRADAEYVDECFDTIYVEPTTADDPRGDWRAFEARTGGEIFDFYAEEVLQLLHTDRDQFSITVLHRGTGAPWKPVTG